jgi:hypothetical protein
MSEWLLLFRFNKQTSLWYLVDPWEDIFDSYHNCSSSKAETVIFHRNGCGPTPELCNGRTPSPTSAYWARRAPRSHRWEVRLANVLTTCSGPSVRRGVESVQA